MHGISDAIGTEHPLGSRGSPSSRRASTGVVARAQLAALGLRSGAIEAGDARAAAPVHRGRLAVGHPVLPRNGRLMAAVLACGEGAVLSHRSAAELWGIGTRARRVST